MRGASLFTQLVSCVPTLAALCTYEEVGKTHGDDKRQEDAARKGDIVDLLVTVGRDVLSKM